MVRPVLTHRCNISPWPIGSVTVDLSRSGHHYQDLVLSVIWTRDKFKACSVMFPNFHLVENCCNHPIKIEQII